jgi:hypothetical protein
MTRAVAVATHPRIGARPRAAEPARPRSHAPCGQRIVVLWEIVGIPRAVVTHRGDDDVAR